MHATHTPTPPSRRQTGCVRLAGLLAVASAAMLVCAPALAAPAAAAKASEAAATITEDQAKAAALKAMPGKVTGVTVEKKRGKMVYVVEIMSTSQGEKDVFVDRVSGKVVGTD